MLPSRQQSSVLLHVVNFSNFLFLLALAQLMLAIMWNFMLTTHSQQLCVWAFCLGSSSSSYSLTLWDFNSTWIIWSKINRALKRLRERIITLCVCTHFMNLLLPPPLSRDACWWCWLSNNVCNVMIEIVFGEKKNVLMQITVCEGIIFINEKHAHFHNV